MGTYLRVQLIPAWQSLDGIQNSLHRYFFGESSFSIERVRASLVVGAMLHHIKSFMDKSTVSAFHVASFY